MDKASVRRGRAQSVTWFLLTLVGHRQVSREFANYGVHHPRLLNITGRWSASGSRVVPLLGWLSLEEATRAAQVASDARSRVVEVVEATSHDLGYIHGVNGSHHAALLGYLPYAAAAANGMVADIQKTMVYASAVLSIFGSDAPGSPLEVAKPIHQSMKQQFGGGSVVSAAQFLCGRKAHDVLCRVLDEEIDCAHGVATRDDLIRAFILAKLVVAQLGKRGSS